MVAMQNTGKHTYLLLLFRLEMITFTHKYRKVVGVDETGEEKDASTCVICLQGNFTSRIDIVTIDSQCDQWGLTRRERKRMPVPVLSVFKVYLLYVRIDVVSIDFQCDQLIICQIKI